MVLLPFASTETADVCFSVILIFTLVRHGSSHPDEQFARNPDYRAAKSQSRYYGQLTPALLKALADQENDVPQPQDFWALGLWNTNP